MIVDEALRAQLIATFEPLSEVPPDFPFPEPRTLRFYLEPLIPDDGTTTRRIDAKSASYFATAAIDIWLRSVHSFLISASLTETSPLWASVSGYYSSHYAVRGLAHLLGYFQLFHRKHVAQLQVERTYYNCTFRPKKKRGGEHQLYWDIVKRSIAFQGDDLYRKNDASEPNSDKEIASEVDHRNHANYCDHLGGYPTFNVLDKQLVKDRIEQISKIVCHAPPFPRFDKYPDLEYVQLIAYHRIVRFRRLLDDTLEGKNAFWESNRTPEFAAEFMNFQLAEWDGLVGPAQ